MKRKEPGEGLGIGTSEAKCKRTPRPHWWIWFKLDYSFGRLGRRSRFPNRGSRQSTGTMVCGTESVLKDNYRLLVQPASLGNLGREGRVCHLKARAEG